MSYLILKKETTQAIIEKVKVIEANYSFKLEEKINKFIRKSEIKILGISSYFDNSTYEHIAVVHYGE